VDEEGGGLLSPPSRDKGPDWYPFGTNPNDQAYWDGQGWTARRRWKGAAWEQIPFDPFEGGREPATAGYAGAGSSSWSPAGAARRERTVSVGAAAPLILSVTGVVIIVGSATPWFALSISIFNSAVRTASVSGISHGGEGWISLIGGILLVLVGMLMLFSEGVLRRLLGQVAAVAAGASFGISASVTERIVSANALGNDVGWGLLLVLLGSVAACCAAAFVSVA
jgi:hypothetical protein